MSTEAICKIAEAAIREGVRITLETPQVYTTNKTTGVTTHKTPDLIEDKIQTYLYELLNNLTRNR